MKNKLLLLFVFSFLVVFSNPISAEGKPKELFWEDLIPKDYQPISEQLQGAHNENVQANWVQPDLDAPVATELNNTLVTLPGFVVPLEGDETTVTEFLLVPYYGACVHVPPPPPNQIVHVTFKEGVPIESLFDAVSVTGTLKTEPWEDELAKVGYQMEGIGIAPFDP
jgi:hypothetical protein